MNQIINLNPIENELSGKYDSGNIILVKCDASNEAFSVTMPSAKSINDVIFIIKKIDSSANAITFSFADDETADGNTSLSLSSQYDSYMLMSDLENFAII
jgi:hypothetical protein